MLGLPEPAPTMSIHSSHNRKTEPSAVHHSDSSRKVPKRRYSANIGDNKTLHIDVGVESHDPENYDPQNLFQVASNANYRLNLLTPQRIDLDKALSKPPDKDTGYDISALEKSVSVRQTYTNHESGLVTKLKKELVERTKKFNEVSAELEKTRKKQLEINTKFNRQLT